MDRPVALITGGGGGIATQIARRLDARGYDLALADIDRSRMSEVARGLARPAALLDADLSCGEGITALATTIERDFPHLHLLVNNAGVIDPGDLVELDPAAIDRQMMINLIAPIHLTRAAARGMSARGRGDILTIVSMGGILALRSCAPYTASKFGLRGFNTSIDAELRPQGVRVLGIFPSGVDTPMLRSEAVHSSGSPLNFVSSVLTTDQVADACVRALDTGRLETYVPYADSVSTRLCGAFPWVIRRIEPLFARVGARGRAKYIRTHGLSEHTVPAVAIGE